MDRKAARLASATLVTLGTLLMLAMAFRILPWPSQVVLFAGIACYVLAGLIHRIAAIEEEETKKAKRERESSP
jgi:hypothetical protein